MMIRKIEQAIKKYSLLEKGETVVVALSGGADSCALLLGLMNISEIYDLKLIAAHFNHGLRGAASDGDELFCRGLARQNGLTYVTEKMCPHSIPRGISPEDFFRRKRYGFLDRVADEYAADKIALGHHLCDQAETVLINILRGSGLDGLKGFLPMRENRYIRPLIDVSRIEIDDFLQKAGWSYREDSSNSSKVYLRNRIRHELIPFLKEKYHPRIEENLARMAEILRRDDEFINGHVREILKSPAIDKSGDEVSFSAEYFKTLPASLAYRVLKSVLEGLVPQGGGVSSSHIQALVDLACKPTSGKINSLPQGLTAQKEYDRIIIQSKETEDIRNYEYVLTVPGTVVLKERSIILSIKRGTKDDVDLQRGKIVFIDGDRIKEPLIVRNRRAGDWFEPLGTKGSQKIKKLFIDRKIPSPERGRIALIADQESVIWIENMHLSERVKVSSQSVNVLVVEVWPHSGGLNSVQENI